MTYKTTNLLKNILIKYISDINKIFFDTKPFNMFKIVASNKNYKQLDKQLKVAPLC